MAIYGPAGSGKTFTALLFAEGLAAHEKKRVAVVDTEFGTTFYQQAVPERKTHPEAFDIDVLDNRDFNPRSIFDVSKAIYTINPIEHGIVIVDSITHLWESAIAAYGGNRTKADTIPFQAWAKIKAPYKALITHLLNAPYHVIICGRQGNEFAVDDDGQLRQVGVKMKAEGETPYEPHVLIRMEAEKIRERLTPIITAIAEKDRTGILYGKLFREPTFAMIQPILALLGATHATIDSAETTAGHDAEAQMEADRAREESSEATKRKFLARIDACEVAKDLAAIGKELTPELKKTLLTPHTTAIREAYLSAEKRLGKG